jgi:dihydroorotate dehydrogenase electron transfer subunit
VHSGVLILKQLNGEILVNKKYSENLYKMEIFSPYICRNALPGQFVNVKCSYNEVLDPLLRRPFSIYEIDSRFNVFSILYLVRGKGTDFLTKLKKGEFLNFIGPLGESIKIEEHIKNYFLVGGGIGVAPLYMIAKSIVDAEKNIIFVAGFKDNNFYNWEKDLVKILRNYKIFTEDGSFGEKGMPVNYIKNNIDEFLNYNFICCGPKEMLKALQTIFKQFNINATAIMEEIVACGIGVCMGCVVKIKNESDVVYKRVCKDGPAFNLMEVIFD